MTDKDWTETTVYKRLDKTLERMADNLITISQDVVMIKTEMPHMASKEDLRKHSVSPTAHGYVAGMTRGQWAKIMGLITALTAAATAIAATFGGCSWLKDNAYPLVKPTCEVVCEVLGDNGCQDMSGAVVPGGDVLKPVCLWACDQIPEELGNEWKECVAASTNCEKSDACMDAYGAHAEPYND